MREKLIRSIALTDALHVLLRVSTRYPPYEAALPLRAGPESARIARTRSMSSQVQFEDQRVQILNNMKQAKLASHQERVEITGVQVPEIGNLPTGTRPEAIIYLRRDVFDMAEIVAGADDICAQ